MKTLVFSGVYFDYGRQLGWAGLKDGTVLSVRKNMGFEVRSSLVQICMFDLLVLELS